MGQLWGIRDIKGHKENFRYTRTENSTPMQLSVGKKCLKSSYSEKIIKKARGESKMKKPWDPRNSRQSKEVLR